MESTEYLQLKDIKQLFSDSSPCIKKISSELTLLLHPMYLSDIKTGVKKKLKSLLKTYLENFAGILVGYDAVKITSNYGWIFHTNPFLHVNILADFYVFAPSIDSVLKGKVVKKSLTHVGCLIHETFNASSFVPMGVSRSEWCGSKVNEGDTIELKITYVDMRSIVPCLKGDIVEESISNQSVLATSLCNSRTVFNDDDSGISSIGKSVELESPKSKKKKREKILPEGKALDLLKKEKLDYSNSLLSTEQNLGNDLSSPRKKKKKKYTSQVGDSTLAEIKKKKLKNKDTSNPNTELTPSNKKKKSKQLLESCDNNLCLNNEPTDAIKIKPESNYGLEIESLLDEQMLLKHSSSSKSKLILTNMLDNFDSKEYSGNETPKRDKRKSKSLLESCKVEQSPIVASHSKKKKKSMNLVENMSNNEDSSIESTLAEIKKKKLKNKDTSNPNTELTPSKKKKKSKQLRESCDNNLCLNNEPTDAIKIKPESNYGLEIESLLGGKMPIKVKKEPKFEREETLVNENTKKKKKKSSGDVEHSLPSHSAKYLLSDIKKEPDYARLKCKEEITSVNFFESLFNRESPVIKNKASYEDKQENTEEPFLKQFMTEKKNKKKKICSEIRASLNSIKVEEALDNEASKSSKRKRSKLDQSLGNVDRKKRRKLQ